MAASDNTASGRSSSARLQTRDAPQYPEINQTLHGMIDQANATAGAGCSRALKARELQAAGALCSCPEPHSRDRS